MFNRKEYMKAYNAWYQLKNKDKLLVQKKEYYKKHKAESKQYYLNHCCTLEAKQAKRKYQAQRRQDPEICKIIKANKKKYYSTQKAREIRSKTRNLKRQEPIERLKVRIGTQIRKKFKRKYKIKKFCVWESLVGYSANDLKQHLENNFLPGMSWDNMKEWHIDHKIPISWAKNENEVIKLFALSNLQPLWAKENVSKGNRWVANVLEI